MGATQDYLVTKRVAHCYDNVLLLERLRENGGGDSAESGAGNEVPIGTSAYSCEGVS